MVRTVKDLFRKANGKAVLNYDQFHTALTDVQAVINSRPLVYVGEDDDEQHPLTPFNLIYGHPSPGGLQGPPPSPADYISSKALTNMDKARRKFANEYTTRFIKEYFTELNKFHSKGNPNPRIPRVGEVVVIHDENAVTRCWQISRVFKTEKDTESKYNRDNLSRPRAGDESVQQEAVQDCPRRHNISRRALIQMT